mgnify:FL=1
MPEEQVAAPEAVETTAPAEVTYEARKQALEAKLRGDVVQTDTQQAEPPQEEKLEGAMARMAKIREQAEKSRELRKQNQEAPKTFTADEVKAQLEAERAQWEQSLRTRDPIDIYGDDQDLLVEKASRLTAYGMGDDAPEALREQNRWITMERKLAELEKRADPQAIEQLVQQRLQQQNLGAYADRLSSYMEAKPADTPILNTMFQDLPDEYGPDALLNAAKELSAEIERVPKEHEVAIFMEAKLERLYSLMSKSMAGSRPKTTKEAPEEEVGPSDITNATLTGPSGAPSGKTSYDQRRAQVMERIRQGAYRGGVAK